MFPIYCLVWNFFKYIKEPMSCKPMSSKFDELKKLHSVRIEEKPTNFLQRLEFFLKCKIGLKESKVLRHELSSFM